MEPPRRHWLHRNMALSLIEAVMRSTLLLLMLVPATWGVAADWPGWRGTGRDGKMSPQQFAPPAPWPQQLDKQWSVEVGEGHSSPVVTGQRIIQFSRLNDQETVSCLTPKGQLLWRKMYDAPYKMNGAARGHGKGPKATPWASDGKVFTFGINGALSAWSVGDGERLWQQPYGEQFPKTSPLYGAAASPLQIDDDLIAAIGGHDRGALIRVDGATGKSVWKWSGDGPSYASPVLATLGGVQQIVTQTQNRAVGLSLDGKLLWSVPYKTPYDQNSVTPLVVGDLLLLSGVQQGIEAYQVTGSTDGQTAKPVWKNDKASLYMSSPVLCKDRLLAFSHRGKGQLNCLNPEDGATIWQGPPRQGDNALLLCQGSLALLLSTGGELLVIDAAADEYRELAKYKVADSPCWAQPAVVGNGVLIKDKTQLTLWTW